MRIPQLPQLDLSEAGLKLTGVALAGGSLAFAAHMMSDPGREPRINGIEHLAIFSKPANHAISRMREQPARGIDDTPVGSVPKKRSSTMLTGYEIIDAAPDWALLRLPEGRIARVVRGARVAGLGGVVAIERRGGKWTLLTEGGVIRAR